MFGKAGLIILSDGFRNGRDYRYK